MSGFQYSYIMAVLFVSLLTRTWWWLIPHRRGLGRFTVTSCFTVNGCRDQIPDAQALLHFGQAKAWAGDVKRAGQDSPGWLLWVPLKLNIARDRVISKGHVLEVAMVWEQTQWSVETSMLHSSIHFVTADNSSGVMTTPATPGPTLS